MSEGRGKGFFSQVPADGDGVSVCGLVACRHCDQVKVKSSGWDAGGPWPRPVRILLLACSVAYVCRYIASATGGRCDKREEE